jgi:nicotinamidase-related amidase
MATALVIIDVQNAILRGLGAVNRQPVIDAALDETIRRLQAAQRSARNAGATVVVVQHDGGPGHRLAPDSDGWRIRDEIKPIGGDILVRKRSCDSFFQTDLDERLRERNVTRLVVGGCMTQFCVDTTCRRAVSMGYDVTLLADGHMTADMGSLVFSQIVAHHNALLDGFSAGASMIQVRTSDEARF